jgi:hypothetical protein
VEIEDEPSAGPLPSPSREDDRVSTTIDGATAVERYRVRAQLGALQREAVEKGDAELEAVVRVEGNAYVIFETLKSFEEHQGVLSSMFFAGDVPYLRARSATRNLTIRARYLHAIATITKRWEDGRAAAEAYLDAIVFYRAQPEQQNFEAATALRHLFPIAAMMSRRYGVSDRYKAEATGFITAGAPFYAASRARLLIDAVSDRKTFTKDDFRAMREAALALIATLAGNDVQLITDLSGAVAKLLARLGESSDAALRAEADALEQRIAMTPEPLLIEMVGSRLLHLYGRLKDVGARRRLVETVRGARARQQFQTFSGRPDGWSEEVEHLRVEAARLMRDYGPVAVLTFLGRSRQFVPAVEDVRVQVEDLAAQGIGVFRQLAQVVVTHGERIVGHESDAFDEQYGVYWLFMGVGRAAVVLGELVTSGDLTLEHFETVFAASWIGRDEHIPYGSGEEMPNDLVWLLRAALRLWVGVQTGDFPGDVLVPALDSLVLRIEAILRKLARLLGQPDTDADAEGVTKYRGIKRLVKDPVIAATLGPDLVQFITFTLIREPEGLRDKIGHAILHFGQYRVVDLDAVVLILLRLAALDVPEEMEDQDAVVGPTTAV